MPAMILMSGFGQTCAFYKSNKKDNHAEVLKVLEEWLKHGDLMDFITNSSAEQYQLAQVESLAYLNWLKKFAKAYLEGEGDDAAAA
jgi:CRISPR-associated protein Cmr5